MAYSKVATSVGFTWRGEKDTMPGEKDVMGIWIRCNEGKKVAESLAKNKRGWVGYTSFGSLQEIRDFWKLSRSFPKQERENVKRGLVSLTDFIKLAPHDFHPAFRFPDGTK